MKPKLTPAQIAVLRELAKDKAQAWLSFDNVKPRVHWCIPGKIVDKTVRALIARNMVENKSGITATITEAGRAYLAELEGNQ